ncbi:hypothetical protein HC823_00755 [Candidatus Gracilibacteria bacterium]|nr:hypothetical protein [Candidatus Gracilibacteria bacterium]
MEILPPHFHFKIKTKWRIFFSNILQSPEKNISDAVESVQSKQFRLISQIQNKYILAESDDGLYFFDQHALHERQRFEQFWNEKDKLIEKKQKLLIPKK